VVAGDDSASTGEGAAAVAGAVPSLGQLAAWTAEQLHVLVPAGEAVAAGLAPSTRATPRDALRAMATTDRLLLRLRPAHGPRLQLCVVESVALVVPAGAGEVAAGQPPPRFCAIEHGPQQLRARALLRATHDLLQQFGPGFLRSPST